MSSIINIVSLCIEEVIKSYTKLAVHPVNLSGKTILITGGNEGNLDTILFISIFTPIA
jgi:hypothetical protein